MNRIAGIILYPGNRCEWKKINVSNISLKEAKDNGFKLVILLISATILSSSFYMLWGQWLPSWKL